MATPTNIAEAYEKAQADYREAIQTEEREIRELADAYLEKRPKAKKRWEEYVAAKQEANSLNRKLGLTMDFGLVKPAELIG
jgi:exonuclease VII large subunit